MGVKNLKRMVISNDLLALWVLHPLLWRDHKEMTYSEVSVPRSAFEVPGIHLILGRRAPF